MTTPIAHRCPGLPDHTRAYVVELPEGVRLLVMADFERVDGPDMLSRLYPYCGGCGQSGRSIRAGKAPFKIAVHPISDADIRRFSKYVLQSDGCWEWTGGKESRCKYGAFHLNVSGTWVSVRAHRVAYAIDRGMAQLPAALICHTCDNPICVRPDHLFAGTNRDNVHDSKRKGRRASLAGASNPSAKLTPESVAEIRGDRTSTAEQCARKHGVSTSTIHRVRRGSTWAARS